MILGFPKWKQLRNLGFSGELLRFKRERRCTMDQGKPKWTVIIINGAGWREKDHCYDEKEVAKIVERHTRDFEDIMIIVEPYN